MPYEELREEDLASWVESGALEEITEGYLDGSGGRKRKVSLRKRRNRGEKG